ncbi:unnamed protein product [Paramecium octaurelia]|uniref:Uncharacterized protein n=1 Tax=Paramecium octaurelia TaxID=43137 RepID=A0A8S1U4I5_PAROT|nr:unnamed protein product [Paramecium octaurelia]
MPKGTILYQSCRKSIKANQCQFYNKEPLILMAQSQSTLVNSFGRSQIVYPQKQIREVEYGKSRFAVPQLSIRERLFGN